MTPEFRDWCQSQMGKLTGDEDLTLIELLMSRESSGEIADYVKVYLGETPLVSSFTAEFIRRKAKESTKRAARRKEVKKARAEPPVPEQPEPRGAAELPPPAAEERRAEGQAPAPVQAKKKQKAKKRVVDPSLLGFSVTSSRIMQGEIELPGA